MARNQPPPAATLHESPDDVEARFYDALQRADITQLMAVWADEDEIVCVHPGGPRLVGAAAIRASFETLFAKAGIPVQPEQVHRLQAPGCAVHHLAESITMDGAQGRQKAWVMATNVYVKTAVGWRLAAHHASPGSAKPPAAASEVPSTLH